MDDWPEDERLVSLLNRLRRDPPDEAAWREFVRLCGPRIDTWCRGWGLQEADANDVTQQVLLELAEQMRTFTYDPTLSFWRWLKTAALHGWSNWVRARERINRVSGEGGDPDEVLRELDRVPTREDLIQRLEEQFDHELLEEACRRVRLRVEPLTWEAFRLTTLEGLPAAEVAKREACRRVRLRVEPLTWEAFRLTALEGLPAAEVAKRLGMPVSHVYVARRRVEKMIRDEVRKLES